VWDKSQPASEEVVRAMAKMYGRSEEKAKNVCDFAYQLFQLQWTVADMQFLDKKYTDEAVHIALEKADNLRDEDAFYYILNKKRSLLLKHIQQTKPIFSWNLM